MSVGGLGGGLLPAGGPAPSSYGCTPHRPERLLARAQLPAVCAGRGGGWWSVRVCTADHPGGGGGVPCCQAFPPLQRGAAYSCVWPCLCRKQGSLRLGSQGIREA